MEKSIKDEWLSTLSSHLYNIAGHAYAIEKENNNLTDKAKLRLAKIDNYFLHMTAMINTASQFFDINLKKII